MVDAEALQRALERALRVGGRAVDAVDPLPVGAKQKPNFVASCTSSRRPAIAAPTTSSLRSGP